MKRVLGHYWGPGFIGWDPWTELNLMLVDCLEGGHSKTFPWGVQIWTQRGADRYRGYRWRGVKMPPLRCPTKQLKQMSRKKEIQMGVIHQKGSKTRILIFRDFKHLHIPACYITYYFSKPFSKRKSPKIYLGRIS